MHPTLSSSKINKFNNYIADYFYETGTSFLRIENKKLAEAMKILHPDAKLPSRKQFSGHLLDESYNKVIYKYKNV